MLVRKREQSAYVVAKQELKCSRSTNKDSRRIIPELKAEVSYNA